MLHIRMSRCALRDWNSIYVLAQALAHYFPKPEQFVAGIHELLLNAIEHGCLGIGFEEKSELLREHRWHEEIVRRLCLPENEEKTVEIMLRYNEDTCSLRISDGGNGFAWQQYLQNPLDTSRPNGRGLRIAFDCNFDKITFNPRGNEVTCTMHYHSQMNLPQPNPNRRIAS